MKPRRRYVYLTYAEAQRLARSRAPLSKRHRKQLAGYLARCERSHYARRQGYNLASWRYQSAAPIRAFLYEGRTH